MKLSTLPIRSSARIVSFAEAEVSIRKRLSILGFVPGTEVTVKRRAPLGSPIEYELRGTSICLRSSEASLIRVEPLDSPDGLEA